MLKPSQCDIKEISITNNSKTETYDITKGFLDFVQSIDILSLIHI